MVEREASGDFDYLWDDPPDTDGLTSHDQAFEAGQAEELDHPPNDPGDDLWDEPADSFWDYQLDPDDPGHFDAFNDNTWRFKPAPTPWYRTGQAATAIIAASAAVAAIVVAGVLLVFRGSGSTVDQVTSRDPDRTDERRAGFGGEQRATATAAPAIATAAPAIATAAPAIATTATTAPAAATTALRDGGPAGEPGADV